jgi:cytochrome P450
MDRSDPANERPADKAARTPSGMTLSDPVIQANPHEFFRSIRERDPVFYDDKLDMYLISRHEDVMTVLRDAETYSCDAGYNAQYAKGFAEEFKEILVRDGGGFFPDAIMTDPPYHTQVRGLLDKAFTAHRVASLEAAITSLVADLIEQLIDRAEKDGVVEIVTDFAVPLTTAIICEQLGFDRLDADKVQRWSHAVVQQIGRMQDRDQMRENARDICELQNYIIARMKEREAQPREDMISDLVHARTQDGTQLTFAEVVSLVRALLIAGNETTAIVLTNLFFILATEPEVSELLQKSVNDERFLTRFVDELLRYDPPTVGLMRMTTREVELGGKLLPRQAHLLVLFSSASNDEAEFDNPRIFDIQRKNLGRHVAFGAGGHRCIGAALARMEIKVAAREVTRRLGTIQLAAPRTEIRYVPTVISHAIARLPITLSPRVD